MTDETTETILYLDDRFAGAVVVERETFDEPVIIVAVPEPEP